MTHIVKSFFHFNIQLICSTSYVNHFFLKNLYKLFYLARGYDKNKTYLAFSHKATQKKKSCLVDIVVLNFFIQKFKAKIKCKFKIDKILEFVVYNFVVFD
jgi:hypothetical protein